MPAFDYRCDVCGFTEEYNTGKHMPKGMQPPEDLKCPNIIEKKCKDDKIRKYKCKGTLEKLFTSSGRVGIDIVGYCYENEYGKKAWKRNLSQSEQAQVVAGDRNPY